MKTEKDEGGYGYLTVEIGVVLAQGQRLTQTNCRSDTRREPSNAAVLGMINDIVFWPGLLRADHKMSSVEREGVVQEAVETFLARCAA